MGESKKGPLSAPSEKKGGRKKIPTWEKKDVYFPLKKKALELTPSVTNDPGIAFGGLIMSYRLEKLHIYYSTAI